MTMMIIGGTGFLGSYLTRHAVADGSAGRVVVFDKYLALDRVADVLDRVTVIEGDVTDPDALRSAIQENGVERIAHFAGILGSPLPGRIGDYVKVQLLGTVNVLECARQAGVRRLLYASSVAAYGKQEAQRLTEELIPNPQNPYGSSKLWCESLASHFTEHLGLDTATIRFGSTYGFGRASRGSYRSGLLAPPSRTHYMARVELAARGEPITMPSDSALADWTYAADAARAAWLALTAEHLHHRLYNVGTERRPVGEFTQAMRKLLPRAGIATSDEEPIDNPHPPLDSSRLRTDLGFAPKFSFEAGLADYLERIEVSASFKRRSSSPGG